jgi:hypothetical protein
MTSTRRRATLIWLVRVLALLLGARTILLAGRYLLGAPSVPRYQVESGAVAFVVVGALAHATRAREGLASGSSVAIRRRPAMVVAELAGWCAASLALYWPVVRIGFLSDDWTLVDRVRHGAFGLVNSEFFRPVPLLAWSGLLHLDGPLAVHLLNVVAHGVVAFLAARLAAPFAASRLPALVAGALVLTFPASVEAVAWASGIFDVAATLLVLLAVLISRRYSDPTPRSTRVALMAIAVAALLSKETAVVVPVLIAVDAWASRRLTRALIVDLAALGVLFVAVGLLRLLFASDMVRQPVTRYLLQRWLFGTVGGLAVPWHHEVITSWPWIPITGVVIAMSLAMAFVVTRSRTGASRTLAASAVWLLAGSLPAVTFFFVAADLQGSRYLYLPTTGHAMLLVTMAWGTGSPTLRWYGTIGLGVLVLLGVVGVTTHQRYWQSAARTRDAILRAAQTDERLRQCGTVNLRGLPDTVQGAYAFRNGAAIVFSDAGLTLSESAAPSCVFSWDQVNGFRQP